MLEREDDRWGRGYTAFRSGQGPHPDATWKDTLQWHRDNPTEEQLKKEKKDGKSE